MCVCVCALKLIFLMTGLHGKIDLTVNFFYKTITHTLNIVRAYKNSCREYWTVNHHLRVLSLERERERDDLDM